MGTNSSHLLRGGNHGHCGYRENIDTSVRSAIAITAARTADGGQEPAVGDGHVRRLCGWNFTQGYVFGAEVSGSSQPHSILQTSVSGPDLLTGGSFGPEASILSLGVSAIVSAVLVVLILRKGGWHPLRFRLRRQTDSIVRERKAI